MSAYVVYVRDRITDPEALKKYEEMAPAAGVGHPATPLAFYGAVETLEGPPVDGVVILAFPTVTDAKAAYDSPLALPGGAKAPPKGRRVPRVHH